MPRRTIKGLLGSNKRDAIVAKAVRLFGERGIDATSMRDVAAAVGITDATLYHYFASKQELAEAATNSVSFDIDEMKALLDANANDVRVALLAIGEAFLAALAGNPPWTRMVIRESLAPRGGVASAAAKAVNDLGRRRSALLAGYLARDGRAESKAIAELSASQFFYSCVGFWISEALVANAVPSSARIRSYLTLLVDGALAALRAPQRASAATRR